MKLRRVVSRMRKSTGRVLLGAVVGAMLVSMMPALSSPAAAWSLPYPRTGKFGPWSLEQPGSHISQTFYSMLVLQGVIEGERWIYHQVRDQWYHLVRGNVWADDYPQAWAKAGEDVIPERVVTWGELFAAAGSEKRPENWVPDSWVDFFDVAFGQSLPDLLCWMLSVFFAAPNELELAEPARIHITAETIKGVLDTQEFQDGPPSAAVSQENWQFILFLMDRYPDTIDELLADLPPKVMDMYLGVRHPDFSLYHIYESDDWLNKLLLDGVDQEFRDALGWGDDENAVSRANFWYQEALAAYEEWGTEPFPDPYTEEGVLDYYYVTAYDYLGRALHYVQDLTQPAHSKDFYRHLQLQAYEAVFCPGQYPSEYDIWIPDPHEIPLPDHTGAYFAQQAHSSVQEYVDAWLYHDPSPSFFLAPLLELELPEFDLELSGEGVSFVVLYYFNAWRDDRVRVLTEGERRSELQSLPGVLAEYLGVVEEADGHLMANTGHALKESVRIGAGMIRTFHKQLWPLQPKPEVGDYYLTVAIDGEGSTDPWPGVYPYFDDDIATVKAAPKDFGWRFAGWVDDDTGDVISTDPEVTIVMDDDKALTAVFEEIPLKFDIGDTVWTTAPLNVRDSPGLVTNVIRTQSGGTAGTILSAEAPYPVLSHGYTWWLVKYDDGTVGWSSDHRLEEYTRPAPRFSVGEDVVTTDALYVRTEPRLTNEHGIYFTDNVSETQLGGSKGTILDSEEPMPRKVMGYNMWKVEYEDGTVGWSSDHRLMEDGTFVPVDLVLVLDKSWSMEWYCVGPTTRLQAAKDAAVSVIDMLTPHDRVAVVSFAGSATIDAQLTGDFEYAKTRIQQISPASATSFGAGMKSALEELEQRGSEDHAWAIVFLSDGEHNWAPHPEPYVQKCVDLGIPIYTVGLANTPAEVDEELLLWMAEETGGKYFFVDDLYDLQNVFLRFTLEAIGWPVAAEFSGLVAEGETVEAGTFGVEAGTEHVRLTLNWPGSDLDLIVIRPDGSEVDLGIGSDNVYSGPASRPKWVILLDPPPGTWTVKVYGRVTNSYIPFTVWVSTYVDPLKEDPDQPVVGGTAYPVNRPVILAFWIGLAAVLAGAAVFLRRRLVQS